MKKAIKYMIIIVVTVCYALIIIGSQKLPIEQLEIVTGVGYDIENPNSANMKYVIPYSVYVFYPNGAKANEIKTGEGKNLGETLENRQQFMDKQTISGVEKAFVLGESYARNGIKSFLEETSRSEKSSDMSFGMVCRGTAEDLFKVKLKGSEDISEYLSGLVEKAQWFNFSSQNYKVIDAFVNTDSEGRNIILPYVEKISERPQITGLAIFCKDKMKLKLPMNQGKTLNMMREDNVKGIISVQRSAKEYLDLLAETKKKVECKKVGDNFKFDIYITFAGQVASNTMFYDLINDVNVKKQAEKELASSIQKKCQDFVADMKSKYRIDLFQLGRVAAAHYGRRTGVDWNEKICDSEINVHVDVKIITQGRGEY